MMEEHGKLCDPQDATYCMNGGTCYKMPSIDTFFCHCTGNYAGSRCEQLTLQYQSLDEMERGLLAAVIIIVILILVVLAVVIYYVQKMIRQGKMTEQKRNKGLFRVTSNI
ncbi:pro-neuregulin-4, membrane-bound isoform-like [Cyprinodon tularosa]|uniref:pro-neuregulin-4, membrane-bound isoform-like n=1 Tax=Cyprinodon tularosa TaxID=77115 RepID=UPI0018E2621E|nr:pro-neuregulin-4, membrane-bound isoform-like [Cyprinodon tularosa]